MALTGREHVDRYLASGGEDGHEWRPGVFALLLTTTGHRTGNPFTTALIYVRDGDDYIVIASKGGAPEHPDWYRNLEANPRVTVQVRDQVMSATARTLTGERRERCWEAATEVWPDFNAYQQRTERTIPVVALTPAV